MLCIIIPTAMYIVHHITQLHIPRQLEKDQFLTVAKETPPYINICQEHQHNMNILQMISHLNTTNKAHLLYAMKHNYLWRMKCAVPLLGIYIIQQNNPICTSIRQQHFTKTPSNMLHVIVPQ